MPNYWPNTVLVQLHTSLIKQGVRLANREYKRHPNVLLASTEAFNQGWAEYMAKTWAVIVNSHDSNLWYKEPAMWDLYI